MRKAIQLELLGKKKEVCIKLHERVIKTWKQTADFLEVSMAEAIEIALGKLFEEVLEAVSYSLSQAGVDD